MRLLIFSHKVLWKKKDATGNVYFTDGGFPFHIQYLSDLFDQTILFAPVISLTQETIGSRLTGVNLKIIPLTIPPGSNIQRKLLFPFWCIKYLPIWFVEILHADAVHTPIPGDVGTAGMLLSWFFQKPLFVRYCGNWFVQNTLAERFWKWFMEKVAGGKNVILATGGDTKPPSIINSNIKWIFSTSLSSQEISNLGSARLFPSNHRLVIVCRQDAQKGTGIVIQACAQLIKYFPDIQLDVVGSGSDLELFHGLVEKLNLRNHVQFSGQVNHEGVISHLLSANLFCYPTAASEGFPKVVLEALATGLPVITTPVSILPLLINKKGCGLIINNRTPEALASAIIKCYSEKDQYERMSRFAIETSREFSLEGWRDKIGEYLEAEWGKLKLND